jgi:hypothetical protein
VSPLVLVLVVIVLLFVFGGGGYYVSRPGYSYRHYDLFGLIIGILLIAVVLRLLGVI